MRGRGLVVLVGVVALGALAVSAAADNPQRIGSTRCTINAYGPNFGDPNYVNASAAIFCPGNHHLQVQTCLQQLVTGGWRNVVGSCALAPGPSRTLYAPSISAPGRAYHPTKGRWYRSWGWGYADGAHNQTWSKSYKG